MRASFGIFFNRPNILPFAATVMITALVVMPDGTSAQTCDGLFAQASGTLLSPTTIAGDVVKTRIVKKLLSKSPAMRAKGRLSTSISASGAGERDTGGRISTKPSSMSPTYEGDAPLIRKQSFQVPFHSLGRGYIRWISDQSLLMSNSKAVEDDAPLSFGIAYESTVINLKTEAVEHKTLLSRGHGNLVSSLRKLPFLIEREKLPAQLDFQYKFLDKETLRELRPALQNVSNVAFADRFISYKKQGKVYLTSLNPRDFGSNISGKGDPEIQVSGIVSYGLGQYVSVAKIWDPHASRISVVTLSGASTLFDYDPATNSYRESKSTLRHVYDMQGSNGNRHTIEADVLGASWKIRTQGEKGFQVVSLAMGANGDPAELRYIFGDGAAKSLILEEEGTYRLVKFGFNSQTFAANGYETITPYGEDFIVLSDYSDQFQRGLSSRGPLPTDLRPVTAVDLKSGRTYDLAKTHQPLTAPAKTALLDSRRYINIDVDIDEKSIVRIHDLETGRLERQLSFGGDVDLVKGTHLLRVENGDSVQFFDLEIERVIWGGSKESKPRVSPDGSRVAYEDDGKLSVMILGDRLESRRTF